MTEKSNGTGGTRFVTTIANKYPSFRDEPLKTVYRWIEGKRRDDGAEGLWRIHDDLYDFTEFIDRHPGGSEWIRVTKGTDITEAFETHHITTRAENLLPKYKVREAKQPRNIRLTFKEDGFYRTLKRRVRDKLQEVDKTPIKTSKLIIDSLLGSVFVFAFLAMKFNSYLLATLCAMCVNWTIISAHNYFHQKDNWRMRLFNLSFFSYREWRISHAISHHLYPNSILDVEISFFEPILCWLPNPAIKGTFQRYGGWIYGPIVYAFILYSELLKRLIATIKTGKNSFFADDMIALILPTFMYLVESSCVWSVLKMWIYITLATSFFFGLVGKNAAHHHPEIFHAGDEIPDEIDFGMYQIAAVMDRADVKGSHFAVLTSFGDHCLHHLFPTLDHGILPQLYPIFHQTCEEFEAVYRECSWLHHIIGQHRQLARIEPFTYQPTKKSK
ncbi:cytochrome b5-related protein [Toxorhynchites rutilus septentrionalis]|uniref:cytochrome b5-related protein n=1 Tax=Toxorhynchites rutilus septentrionalis TaxID=329112 RepID=UPI0024783B37|nr:cytochrome b5-related protein [Toxorhynchites rutilus septentrionalis]XP_055634621.1 cytochrome b5-related protein [Toxorhynchites rutilus septentrionalis]XP_055634622.1 cytochrome b5-related protein [Toxorhynchites rutilus septentrionalis]XP_055634623.1 cytochrome b5-related protein [Toxorhynchites rutilus septentrionalis]